MVLTWSLGDSYVVPNLSLHTLPGLPGPYKPYLVLTWYLFDPYFFPIVCLVPTWSPSRHNTVYLPPWSLTISGTLYFLYLVSIWSLPGPYLVPIWSLPSPNLVCLVKTGSLYCIYLVLMSPHFLRVPYMVCIWSCSVWGPLAGHYLVATLSLPRPYEDPTWSGWYLHGLYVVSLLSLRGPYVIPTCSACFLHGPYPVLGWLIPTWSLPGVYMVPV